MFWEMLETYLGDCPKGYELIYLLFSFFLLIVGLDFIYRIFDALFSIFKRGR